MNSTWSSSSAVSSARRVAELLDGRADLLPAAGGVGRVEPPVRVVAKRELGRLGTVPRRLEPDDLLGPELGDMGQYGLRAPLRCDPLACPLGARQPLLEELLLGAHVLEERDDSGPQRPTVVGDAFHSVLLCEYHQCCLDAT